MASAWPALAGSHYSHSRDRDEDAPNEDTAFKVGGLKFYMPPHWVAEPAETPARAGQWRIKPPYDATSDDGRLIAFFFGTGHGGSAKESIDAWMGTMFTTEGHPAAAEVKYRVVNGCKISQVVVFGTYSDPVPLPGFPPVSKPGYGLIGTVVENPHGNIYWRFTGPEPLVAANIPLFNKMIDSVRPESK